MWHEPLDLCHRRWHNVQELHSRCAINLMINFSKVARSLFGQPLKEEPMVDGEFVPPNAPQRQQRRETPPVVRRGGGNNVGDGGHNLESQVAQNLLPQIYPNGNFNHVDSVVGGQQAASIKKARAGASRPVFQAGIEIDAKRLQDASNIISFFMRASWLVSGCI